MNRVGKALFMKVPSARSVSDKGALTHVLSCPSEKNPANLSIYGAVLHKADYRYPSGAVENFTVATSSICFLSFSYWLCE